ncbi:MAG: deaminase [Rubripirellula sp.]
MRFASSRQRLSLCGCVLYSTCEPCPMCMSACIWAELDAVVYGVSRWKMRIGTVRSHQI